MTTILEATHRELGPALARPVQKAAAVAVISNPHAGRFTEDLEELIALGEELGGFLARRALLALGVGQSAVQAYGKGAIVGSSGELEHAAAILHPRFGAPLRAVVGGGAALIPSSKKVGGLGASLDVPLGHKADAYVRSHFDAMEIRIPDAPRPDEIVVAVVLTDSGRPDPRVGGLTHEEAESNVGAG